MNYKFYQHHLLMKTVIWGISQLGNSVGLRRTLQTIRKYIETFVIK